MYIYTQGACSGLRRGSAFAFHSLSLRVQEPHFASTSAGYGRKALGSRRHSRCESFPTQEILDDFFVHRIQALAEELLGVLVNPILLWFCLAPAASDIVSVMRSLQHSTENLGDWCVYGCLDTACVRENEKLEKSALSFLLNHQLLWSPDESSYDCMPSEFHSCEVQMKALHELQPLENEALEWHADGPPLDTLDTPNTWHAEGDARGDRRDVAHILGTPSSALSLLQNVQDFQKRAMLENPKGENYGLLPSELVQVPEINPGAPANDAIARAAKMVVEEQRQDTLDRFGALFFWLEARLLSFFSNAQRRVLAFKVGPDRVCLDFAGADAVSGRVRGMFAWLCHWDWWRRRFMGVAGWRCAIGIGGEGVAWMALCDWDGRRGEYHS